MRLSEIDSSKLLFDLKAGDLAEQLEVKFVEFSDYSGAVDRKKVATYVVLMADMNSPMRAEKPDYYARKFTCALMAGFPKSKKEFTKDAESIVIGEDEAVNSTIIAYTLSYGLPSFALLQAYMALMSFEMQKIFGGKQTKDSQKIIDGANDRIQQLTREFFRSGDYDEYSKVRQQLYAKVEKEREKLRPEELIRYLEKEGTLPEGFSPYGDDYSVSPSRDLIFMGDGGKK